MMMMMIMMMMMMMFPVGNEGRFFISMFVRFIHISTNDLTLCVFYLFINAIWLIRVCVCIHLMSLHLPLHLWEPIECFPMSPKRIVTQIIYMKIDPNIYWAVDHCSS